MYIKKVTILSFLLFFGVMSQGFAETIESIENTENKTREKTIIKSTLFNIHPSNTPTNVPIIESVNSCKDCGSEIGDAKFDTNLRLKSLKIKKELKLGDLIDEVCNYYKFDKNVWDHQFLGFEIKEVRSLNSEPGHSSLGSYSKENGDFEKERVLATFRFLDSKKPEIFTEIYMLFRLPFSQKFTHVLLEINSVPFSENGNGFFIPFKQMSK